jgi:two-component system sensor kinase FixL
MPVPPDELALSQDYWDAAARRGTLKARKRSGEIFPVELMKAEVETCTWACSIVSFNDTSFQQRLKQRISDLQQELSHLSRYMLLGELTTAITHEVKQPLAAIATYAAAALQPRSASGLDAKDIRAVLGKIGAQAERCGDIIDKLKRLVSDQGIDAVYDDLCSTVQEAVEFVSIAAAKHNIEITVELPPHPVILLMDGSQIFMLVSNLVKNAIDELSQWRHERKIEVAVTLPGPDMAQLTVADTGPGIHAATFEKMFDPFHTTKPEGNGMGLALSRRIAEAHSGRLAAANRPGGGAIFSFVLPVGNNERVGNDDASIIAHCRR